MILITKAEASVSQQQIFYASHPYRPVGPEPSGMSLTPVYNDRRVIIPAKLAPDDDPGAGIQTENT